jgi:hypothetical protein
MTRARYNHSATYVVDKNAVFVAGGTDGAVVHAVPELILLDSTVTELPLAVPVQGHAAHLTQGGNVAIAGGTTDVQGNYSTDAVQWTDFYSCYAVRQGLGPYDYTDRCITYLISARLSVPRSSIAMCSTIGNRLLIIGGLNGPLATGPTFPPNNDLHPIW